MAAKYALNGYSRLRPGAVSDSCLRPSKWTVEMSTEVPIGNLSIDVREQWTPHRGFAVDREEKEGQISGSILKGPDRLVLDVSHIKWDDGSEEIKATNLISGPNRFQNIVSRHMMSVRELNGDKYAEISLTKLALDGKAGKVQCDITEWNAAADLDVEEFLMSSHAMAIGTREELEGITSNRRNYLTVQMSSDDNVTPVLVWALSKALPVFNQYGLAGF